MKNLFRGIGILLLLTVPLAGWGCAKDKQAKPLPPKAQENKYQEEPTISLFVNQTGEKKNIKLEDYLAGVVAAEMEPTWPVEALAAQAILARTFTMENIQAGRVRKIHGTDASTSVEEFQAYNPTRINDSVRKAVEMTRGEVALYKGRYIRAWFHACDGGITATAKEGLAYIKEPTPYIKVVKDGCMDITVPENKAWRAEFPVAQVQQAASQQGVKTGTITSAQVIKKGPSGRAEKIKLGKGVVGGPALRLALGSEKLRSMLLTDIRVEGGKVIFQGKGYGHGVGMCQWGARDFAQQGKKPEDIVKYYFKDISIAKKWK
ncbi:MAG: SpoIID/LytB domain-containing protein [Clostridia bacterium]|nr:SpoIID/LytB domain-containing protein [Clostridia bacterium]